MKAEVSCDILFLLGVSGGKGRKEDSAYYWPWRDGLLFHPHDCRFVIKGECSSLKVSALWGKEKEARRKGEVTVDAVTEVGGWLRLEIVNFGEAACPEFGK